MKKMRRGLLTLVLLGSIGVFLWALRLQHEYREDPRGTAPAG
jgi:hypothetical protein